MLFFLEINLFRNNKKGKQDIREWKLDDLGRLARAVVLQKVDEQSCCAHELLLRVLVIVVDGELDGDIETADGEQMRLVPLWVERLLDDLGLVYLQNKQTKKVEYHSHGFFFSPQIRNLTLELHLAKRIRLAVGVHYSQIVALDDRDLEGPDTVGRLKGRCR